jgi:hypothetical protein
MTGGLQVTHEYVLATGGVIFGAPVAASGPAGMAAAIGGSRGRPSAIAWAADRLLAIGSDGEVRAVSRGDSHMVDLHGGAVTALPAEPDEAELRLRRAVQRGVPFELEELLRPLLPPGADSQLETGGRADLAIWSHDPLALPPERAMELRIVRVVRGGRLAASPTAPVPHTETPA